MLRLCLVIQRDRSLSRQTVSLIEPSGIKSYVVDSIGTALLLVGQWRFDVVLLDADGIEGRVPDVIGTLTRKSLPLIVLTSGASEDEQLAWLRRGATEVMLRPASPRLVSMKMVRLAEIANAPDAELPAELRAGPLVLDLARRTAWVDEFPVRLTAREFELLVILVAQEGRFMHRRAMAHALKSNSGRGSRSVDMLVCRVRSKLHHLAAGRLELKTVYGIGYALVLGPRVGASPEASGPVNVFSLRRDAAPAG